MARNSTRRQKASRKMYIITPYIHDRESERVKTVKKTTYT
ncbi:MAG: hypothetical protein ACK4SY_10005 [Pyrobaculum sp.]